MGERSAIHHLLQQQSPQETKEAREAVRDVSPAPYTAQPSGLLILDFWVGGCDPGRDPPAFQGSGCSQKSGSAPGNGANTQQHPPGIG